MSAQESAEVIVRRIQQDLDTLRMMIPANCLDTSFTILIRCLAEEFSVSVPAIRGRGRPECIVQPRHVGYYLANRHISASAGQIARAFCRKSSSTIASGIQCCLDRMATQKAFADRVERVESRFLEKIRPQKP